MDLREHFKDTKFNIDNLQRVYDYLLKEPGAPTAEIGRVLEMGLNAKRYVSTLQLVKLISKNNVPHELLNEPVGNSKPYPPLYIGTSTVAGSNLVEFVAFLSTFNDTDEVPGWFATKSEILDELHKIIVGKADANTLGVLFQKLLAINALATNDISFFRQIKDPKPCSKKFVMEEINDLI